jgi:predicted HTH domain antitoxin
MKSKKPKDYLTRKAKLREASTKELLNELKRRGKKER